MRIVLFLAFLPFVAACGSGGTPSTPADEGVSVPTLTVTHPTDGQVVHGLLDVGGLSAGADEVSISVDGAAFVLADGTAAWTWVLDTQALREGPHEIIVRAANDSWTVEEVVELIVSAESPPAPECATLVAGTPLPYPNAAAPARPDLTGVDTVYVEIIGHSENRGYDDELQALLDANPPLGKSYVVTNQWIGGHETWRWTTPGERGYEVIEGILEANRGFTIALILTSNNTTYPIRSPAPSDDNYQRFVSECLALADHLHDGGSGASMCYFTAHRMKPANLMPCYHENLAIGDVMATAALTDRPFLKPGPEQHDLHWCCYPDCYATDRAHTNAQGDVLMAEAWFAFLLSELEGP